MPFGVDFIMINTNGHAPWPGDVLFEGIQIAYWQSQQVTENLRVSTTESLLES